MGESRLQARIADKQVPKMMEARSEAFDHGPTWLAPAALAAIR
jgi:hypothetical protein